MVFSCPENKPSNRGKAIEELQQGFEIAKQLEILINRSSSGDKDKSSSSKSTTMTVKYRRGCYKRRKTEDTWSTETLNWVEDGHSWRKYGQKVILNCKYPRNYYRCTNKSGGCPAKKHVQQIRDWCKQRQ